MGYVYGWSDQAELVKELEDPGLWGGRVLETHLAGHEHWMLIEEHGRPIILVNLLDQMYGRWGYKTLDEQMGPYYYQCPVEWLERAPVANEAWRARVRKAQKAEAA